VLTLFFIIIFIKLIRLPAVIVLGFWFFLQLLGVMGGSISNVAFFAHIGGFIAGLLLVKVFQPRWAKRRRRY
jgi:membrane associated rhomboid family serine protease